MSILKPFGKAPEPDKANILLVESEEQFQQKLADRMMQQEKNFKLTVSLAKRLPVPVQNEESRPRIDLVVFIIDLVTKLSYTSAETSLKYLDPGYFVGKVCFLVINARHRSASSERLLQVRKLADYHQCPLLCAEHQTTEGVTAAAERLLSVLKVAASLVPTVTSAYLSTLTRCVVSCDMEMPETD